MINMLMAEYDRIHISDHHRILDKADDSIALYGVPYVILRKINRHVSIFKMNRMNWLKSEI